MSKFWTRRGLRRFALAALAAAPVAADARLAAPLADGERATFFVAADFVAAVRLVAARRVVARPPVPFDFFAFGRDAEEPLRVEPRDVEPPEERAAAPDRVTFLRATTDELLPGLLGVSARTTLAARSTVITVVEDEDNAAS